MIPAARTQLKEVLREANRMAAEAGDRLAKIKAEIRAEHIEQRAREPRRSLFYAKYMAVSEDTAPAEIIAVMDWIMKHHDEWFAGYHPAAKAKLLYEVKFLRDVERRREELNDG